MAVPLLAGRFWGPRSQARRWGPLRCSHSNQRRLSRRRASEAPDRMARHGSSRARRRLRSDQVRAESAPDRQALHARDAAYPAELFVHAGAQYVVPDFINVLEANGSLMPMADQVRRAVAWVYRNASSFGGAPNRIYSSGHSSGGHLAGVVLVTDWKKDFNLPADTVKGGLCCSGMFDLKPMRLSARSAYVKLTDEVEQALSPQRHLDRITAPVVLAYGTLETPEFQRQSRDFAAAVKAAGKPVQLLVGEGYNHFEIPETLANPYGLLGRAVLEQMNLSRG